MTMKRRHGRWHALACAVPILLVASVGSTGCDRGEVTLSSGPGAASETHRVLTRIETREGRSVMVAEVDPSSPWKMNLDFPTALAATEGMQQRWEATDAVRHEEDGVRFEVELPADLESVEGTLHFSVCTPQECRFANAPVAWRIGEDSP